MPLRGSNGTQDHWSPPEPQRRSIKETMRLSRPTLPARMPLGTEPLLPPGDRADGLEEDAAWTNDLIHLISELDQVRVRLSAPKVSTQPAAGLPLLMELMERTARFAIAQLRGKQDDALQELLARVREWVGDAGALEKAVQVSPLQALRSFFGNGPARPDADQLQQHFHELASQVVQLLRGFFELFHECFVAPAAAAEWRQTFEVFLHELAQANAGS
jgi:hypothetical protein